VVAGLELNYGGIEGLSEELIGREGIGNIYGGPEAALATWRASPGRGGHSLVFRHSAKVGMRVPRPPRAAICLPWPAPVKRCRQRISPTSVGHPA